ncbi:FAD-dependent monooxygenase [Bosea sp. (in: a-proteobacteria)]|uniref:FAD-dependent monooxygenase n=1 Tax=Bosea sp. (in: a-proteobacteria) TaxID=1871050 RepID=UPI002627A5F6|nr:FAD-dependent monooxygenase [Bosea sp. (in: a-proteobacteria)]MCO5091358.1 FAD-dependent monooxygenase [Bosea sp. (in: a-proteobacteria)]
MHVSPEAGGHVIQTDKQDHDVDFTGRDIDVAADEAGCAIVGAGPAGLMLGLLLARAGIAVTVLEITTSTGSLLLLHAETVTKGWVEGDP